MVVILSEWGEGYCPRESSSLSTSSPVLSSLSSKLDFSDKIAPEMLLQTYSAAVLILTPSRISVRSWRRRGREGSRDSCVSRDGSVSCCCACIYVADLQSVFSKITTAKV